MFWITVQQGRQAYPKQITYVKVYDRPTFCSGTTEPEENACARKTLFRAVRDLRAPCMFSLAS